MQKKDIVLGLVNGIIIFLISRLVYAIDPIRLLTIPSIPVILIVEFFLLRRTKKSRSMIFYAISLVTSIILSIWAINISIQY